MDEKLVKLNKILELMQNDTLKPSDVKEFLMLVLSVIKEAKKDFSSITSQGETAISDALDFIKKKNDKLLSTFDGEKQIMTADFDKKMEEINSMMREIRAIEIKDGKDGKDADEEAIFNRVMAAIPPQKEFVLDGTEIVSAINALPQTDSNKIDWAMIKNVPDFATRGSKIIGGGGGVREAPKDGKIYGRQNREWVEVTTGGGTWGSITGTLSDQTDLQDALDLKYDASNPSGYVSNLSTFTTANLADSSNKRYVTDAHLTILGNTSGVNTGDNATNTQYSGLAASKQDALSGTGFVKISGTTISYDNSTYLTTATAASTYQPLDAQLTDLAGLSYSGNALKVIRVNAGETGFELATVSGGSGATTALDNLASVAINTSLISDTDITDDLGSAAVRWNNLFVGTIGATGTRVIKIWATDMTVTNAISGSVTGNAATATALQNARTIGGVSFDGTANITVASATGGFTISGGDLALGANNITMTGSIGSTGSRITKLWATDITVTNAISGSITGNAGTATALASTRTIWGQNFDGTGNVTGSLTAVTNITGGASSMTITAGTGNSRTMALQTTTSGGVATTFLSGDASQNTTLAGNLTLGASTSSITGAAGNMTITAGTGNSRTMILRSTTSGGVATAFLTGNADQSVTFGAGATLAGTLVMGANSITMTGSIAATGARVTKGWFTDIESTNMPTVGGTAILTSLTAPQFTTIELGAASDTTLARIGAGRVSIEGVEIDTISAANTLTNKTLTTPVINGTITGTGQATAATASTIMMRDANANSTVANMLEGYTTTATAAGTTTLTVSSNNMQYFTGVTTQTVVMPVASTLVLGQSWWIINLSTGAVTVNSSGSNAIVVIAAGCSAEITCILTSGTSAASWNAMYIADIVASGKKLNVSNSITLAGTDGTTMTFPSTSKTIAANDGSNWTFASQAIGDLVYASSTSAFTRLAAVAVGQVLVSAGTGTAPAWSASPQITSIELGHASDTTIARVSAGVVSIEGVTIATASNSLTFTNKSMSEAQITFTDITTGNASTSNHGFLAKLPNDASKFMDGTGAWSTPSASVSSTAGVGSVAAGTHVHTATITVTHGLGKTPTIIRLHSISPVAGSTSSSSASFSHGCYNASGQTCIYLPRPASGSNADPSTSTTYAIYFDDGTSQITGVVQNVGSTTFDIALTNSAFFDNVSNNKLFYHWEAM